MLENIIIFVFRTQREMNIVNNINRNWWWRSLV